MARYDQQTYFVTHNSYANSHDGYWYANQRLNIPEQLELGVRGLMLDTYYDDASREVVMYHGGKCTNRFAQPLTKPARFLDALQQIYEFLAKNHEAVVTIFLENYASAEQIDNAVERSVAKCLVFRPDNRSPYDDWPTLSELSARSQRLIIFNDHGSSHYTWSSGIMVRQNHYSTLKEPDVLQDMNCDHHAKLYFFNYFPLVGKFLRINPLENYPKINDAMLKSAVKKLDRRPTFIALNFLEKLPMIE